jgi:hypothetical protein
VSQVTHNFCGSGVSGGIVDGWSIDAGIHVQDETVHAPAGLYDDKRGARFAAPYSAGARDGPAAFSSKHGKMRPCKLLKTVREFAIPSKGLRNNSASEVAFGPIRAENRACERRAGNGGHRGPHHATLRRG